MTAGSAGAGAMRLFVFGCGYSARRFVDRLDRSAVQGATTRSRDKAAGLAAAGLTPFVFDGANPGEGIDAALFRTTHLLVSVAPGPHSPGDDTAPGAPSRDPVLRCYRDAIARATPALRWIGYLSTVGVYGDHGGAWVDETTPPTPASERSRDRMAAEEDWHAVARERGVSLAILRLSGIYGPGRNAFVALREERARRLVKPAQVFNRIHVDDIAGALDLLTARTIGGVFNVTDDEPAPPQDVVAAAADMVGREPPPAVDFEAADLSPMARSFYGENKRVANTAIKAAGYRFSFPTYREGLTALMSDFSETSAG